MNSSVVPQKCQHLIRPRTKRQAPVASTGKEPPTPLPLQSPLTPLPPTNWAGLRRMQPKCKRRAQLIRTQQNAKRTQVNLRQGGSEGEQPKREREGARATLACKERFATTCWAPQVFSKTFKYFGLCHGEGCTVFVELKLKWTSK